jgi:hypothetical protein
MLTQTSKAVLSFATAAVLALAASPAFAQSKYDKHVKYERTADTLYYEPKSDKSFKYDDKKLYENKKLNDDKKFFYDDTKFTDKKLDNKLYK